MYDFGSSTPLTNLIWNFTIFPAFNIIQSAKFAGVTLVSILLGFFFIRLAYRFIILPLVGYSDSITTHTDKVRANWKKKREKSKRSKHRD